MDPFAFGADVVNAGISLLNNRANRNFAREQATTAFNRQVQLMNMQNEYNTPANQIARLVEAGLNPNLAYGQLQNGLSAPSVPQGAAYNQNDPQILLQNAMAAKQIESMDIDNELKQKKVDQDIKESMARVGLDKAQSDYIIEQMKVIPVSIFEIEQRISLMSMEQRSMAYDVMMKSFSWRDVADRLAAEANISKTQAANYQRYLVASITGLEAEAKRVFSQIKLNSVLCNVAKEQADMYKQSAALLKAQAGYQNSVNDTLFNSQINFQMPYIDDEGKVKGQSVTTSPFEAQLLQSVNASQISTFYQAGIYHLLQKYGDKKEALELIKAGFQIFSNASSGFMNFFPSRKITDVNFHY